ncbi:hypothetical protein [Hyphomicrobium sp.]|uniref:hypothetical protein n=1 Tax=Hyphomicrobium sp. TaxID=82 RepID=UPI0025BBC118|nr:hypothetical protein [Hyphomicrobium sp.]MCC7251271.1 hypothetical protein [Hyphomicrobium sp.]
MSEVDPPQARWPEEPVPLPGVVSPENGHRTNIELMRQELQATVKWTLAREENAATIILRLSHRVDQESELAQTARSYAARLRLCVARISALMPPEPRVPDHASVLGAVSEAVIQSLDADDAAAVLMKFLRHHAETAPVVLMSAGERLNSRGFERLWQRAARDRARLAKWVENEQQRQAARLDGGSASEGGGEQAPASVREAVEGPGSDDEVRMASPTIDPNIPRIRYNPTQIVRWM